MLSKIKEILSISTGIKLLIGGMLGLISKYAFINVGMYYFAFKMRITLPSEGAEVMSTAENFVSSIASVMVGVFFTLLMFVIPKLYKGLQPKTKEESQKILKKIKTYLIFLFCPTLAAYFILETFFKNTSWNIYLLYVSYFFMLVAISATLRYNINFKTYIVLAASLGFYISIFFTFVTRFDFFLRLTKYGGGHKIRVVERCKDAEKCPDDVEGYLIFRSKDYCFVYFEKNKEVKEIPISKDTQFEYPLDNKEWKLPQQF